MTVEQNEFGQPIGWLLSGWTVPEVPVREIMAGRFCALEPLDAGKHAAELWGGFEGDAGIWTYLASGPFEDFAEFEKWVANASSLEDFVFFAIRDLKTGLASGVASYLRIAPRDGSIEVGNLSFAARLQRTPAATEAMYLMMKKAFELGYRRYEWKCNSLNGPSKRAAVRFGFTYEGTFRQAMMVKGRNRDTAWFSVLDREWPMVRAGFEAWLAPGNFDAEGRQLRRLEECREKTN